MLIFWYLDRRFAKVYLNYVLNITENDDQLVIYRTICGIMPKTSPKHGKIMIGYCFTGPSFESSLKVFLHTVENDDLL